MGDEMTINQLGCMNINEIALQQWNWVEDMGWHKDKRPLEYLGLIASEVGEAVNECRGNKPTDKLGSELADIILRTIDFAEEQGIDIEDEIHNKMMLNFENGTRGRTK